MEIVLGEKVRKIIKLLSKVEQSRISGYIDLFSVNGFNMTGKYLKKIDSNLWELRPGDIRLLFGVVHSKAIFVNIFKKKTQKTPRQEIQTAKNRLKGYQI